MVTKEGRKKVLERFYRGFDEYSKLTGGKSLKAYIADRARAGNPTKDERLWRTNPRVYDLIRPNSPDLPMRVFYYKTRSAAKERRKPGKNKMQRTYKYRGYFKQTGDWGYPEGRRSKKNVHR